VRGHTSLTFSSSLTRHYPLQAKKLYIQCIQCSGIEIGSEDLAHTELVLLDAPIDEPELVTSTYVFEFARRRLNGPA